MEHAQADFNSNYMDEEMNTDTVTQEASQTPKADTSDKSEAKNAGSTRRVTFNRAPRGNAGSAAFAGRGRAGAGRGGKGAASGGRGRSPRKEKVKPEFETKTINIRRVTRVVSGGRRFSFSAAVVIGNRSGSVGVGVGKAGDTGLAIQKAFTAAKKAMIKVNLTDSNSIAHKIEAKASSARAELKPNSGKGLVAGSSLRTVLELAGITDVTAKILSPSRNKLNNARVAVAALAKLRS